MKDSFVLNGRMDENSCQKVKIIYFFIYFLLKLSECTKDSLTLVLHSFQNLADQFGRSPSNKENNNTFNAENAPSQVNSAERKRKAENVTTDKIVKSKRVKVLVLNSQVTLGC